jgi:hypothetical protein
MTVHSDEAKDVRTSAPIQILEQGEHAAEFWGR